MKIKKIKSGANDLGRGYKQQSCICSSFQEPKVRHRLYNGCWKCSGFGGARVWWCWNGLQHGLAGHRRYRLCNRRCCCCSFTYCPLHVQTKMSYLSTTHIQHKKDAPRRLPIVLQRAQIGSSVSIRFKPKFPDALKWRESTILRAFNSKIFKHKQRSWFSFRNIFKSIEDFSPYLQFTLTWEKWEMNQHKKVIEISDPTPYQQAEKKRRPDPYQKKEGEQSWAPWVAALQC